MGLVYHASSAFCPSPQCCLLWSSDFTFCFCFLFFFTLEWISRIICEGSTLKFIVELFLLILSFLPLIVPFFPSSCFIFHISHFVFIVLPPLHLAYFNAILIFVWHHKHTGILNRMSSLWLLCCLNVFSYPSQHAVPMFVNSFLSTSHLSIFNHHLRKKPQEILLEQIQGKHRYPTRLLSPSTGSCP